MTEKIESKIESTAQSENLGKLFSALSKAQAEMKPAILDMKNPHYNSKYASLTSIKESYQGPIAKNELCLIQVLSFDGSQYYIETILGHSSGEFISSNVKLLIEKQNMQGLGSAITYAKRYAASAMLGIVDTEDDDGNAASEKKPKEEKKEFPKPPKLTQEKTDVPSQPQLARLFAIATERGWTKEQIKTFMHIKFNIDSTKLLKSEQYEKLVKIIETSAYEDQWEPSWDDPSTDVGSLK